ncbi:MAG: multiple sugar transport system permease protein [Candidatus Atribacteria bacterium]|nr:multiple sugar transport system permease protein [Candidatus Atribacteria bacterium]
MLGVGIGLIVLFASGPLLWMGLCSFKPKVEFFSVPPTVLPKQWTVENFIKLFQETHFPKMLLNSLYAAVGTVAISVTVASLAAYSLARLKYPGKKIFVVFSLFAYLLPPILLIIPLYAWMVSAGLLDRLEGLIITYIALCLPYSIYLLRAFFRSIPLELEEAAAVDGASPLRTLFSIVLPVSLPGIIATVVYSFNYVWNEYLFALVLLTSESKKTFPVGLQSFITEFDIYWEYILSGSVVVSLPALFLLLITQERLVKGWGAGALKE